MSGLWAGLRMIYTLGRINGRFSPIQRGYSILRLCCSVVKLVKNFRSHEAILKFPNMRFYGNELEPCADKKITNAYLGSPYLPNKIFPVIFHSVCGKDDREASSPSFFNIEEVLQVKAYVQQLKADRVFRTSEFGSSPKSYTDGSE